MKNEFRKLEEAEAGHQIVENFKAQLPLSESERKLLDLFLRSDAILYDRLFSGSQQENPEKAAADFKNFFAESVKKHIFFEYLNVSMLPGHIRGFSPQDRQYLKTHYQEFYEGLVELSIFIQQQDVQKVESLVREITGSVNVERQQKIKDRAEWGDGERRLLPKGIL